MKLSDYVAQYLLKLGIQHVFVVAGGACLHIIDSISKTEGIDYVCTHHEQAAAMAADSYARTTGNIGAAVATSGPGATNLITGICTAFYDSIPVLFVTGQVSTLRFKDKLDVRQIGFQETAVVPICKTITKYAVRIDDSSQIRHELEKAAYFAKEGRPGPVLVDIPDNLQREEIDPERLKSFDPREYHAADATDIDEKSLGQLVQLLNDAERPFLVVGWGVRISNAIDEARELIDRLGIPVLLTWAMNDLLPHDHPLNVGSFGTHGTRYGNFTVQNSDLVLSVGSRLDTHTSGSPIGDFARDAKLIIVDVDPGEIDKFDKLGRHPHMSFKADAGQFIRSLGKCRIQRSNRLQKWIEQISLWKNQFPICPEELFSDELVNPYVFFYHLSDASSHGDLFLSDTGCTIAWMMQSFRFKSDQRIFHAFNNTPMGYALPASIAAAKARPDQRIICVSGDGSFQMNIQELATVAFHKLPIKIFILNNHGYSMIQQTQDQWLNSKYVGSSEDGGIMFQDYAKLAEAYGFKAFSVTRNNDLKKIVSEVMNTKGTVLCNVEIDSDHRVIPQVKYGRPIEDAEPLLDRAVFNKSMIIKPKPASSSMD